MIPLCLALVKEWEKSRRIWWDLIAHSHSSLESKKSLEERENTGVDPTIAIPMIQKRCTPNEEGSDSEPWAETVSWPLTPLLSQPLFSMSASLASLYKSGKVCVCTRGLLPIPFSFHPLECWRNTKETECEGVE